MKRKTALALALAGAFTLSTFTAYANDEKSEEKGSGGNWADTARIVAQSDEKKEEKSEGGLRLDRDTLAQSDEKSEEKSEGGYSTDAVKA